MMLTKDEVSKKVGDKIRQIRVSKGLSIEKLATESGIEYSQLSRIELGKINTSIYHLYIISNSLKVAIPDLMPPPVILSKRILDELTISDGRSPK